MVRDFMGSHVILPSRFKISSQKRVPLVEEKPMLTVSSLTEGPQWRRAWCSEIRRSILVRLSSTGEILPIDGTYVQVVDWRSAGRTFG